jgi:hypothetical protein
VWHRTDCINSFEQTDDKITIQLIKQGVNELSIQEVQRRY